MGGAERIGVQKMERCERLQGMRNEAGYLPYRFREAAVLLVLCLLAAAVLRRFLRKKKILKVWTWSGSEKILMRSWTGNL